MVAAHFVTLASGSSLHGAGKLSPLMITGPSRLPALPGVPTAKEVGIDGMDFNQWWAVVAPATTPVEIVERLRAAVGGRAEPPSNAPASQHPGCRPEGLDPG